ncbi:antitoxin [Ammonicoccus fulvus]|uniref:Antitoxin n=1 Tax=Ammonicoccus fulvus TaxID=3138240 RepID=A0ABZ3FK44_9ACTN
MTDVLIRGVPDDDVQRIDAEAARLGLSRNAFLRREMNRIARHRTVRAATAEDYRKSLEALTDLESDEVMRQAWS